MATLNKTISYICEIDSSHQSESETGSCDCGLWSGSKVNNCFFYFPPVNAAHGGIPVGSLINSATLRLAQVSGGYSEEEDIKVTLRSGNWGAFTWDSQPALAVTGITKALAGTSPGDRSFDVTSLIQWLVDNNNSSHIFKLERVPNSATGSNDAKRFSTTPSQHDLLITYTAPTAPTAPTSPNVTPSPFQDTVRLGWTKGINGVRNLITGYNVQYQLSWDASNWGVDESFDLPADFSFCDISSEVVSEWPAGMYIRFRVGSKSTYFPTAYSGYSPAVRKSSAPTAPTALTPTPSPFQTALRLGWTKGTDGVSNPITGHELRFQTSPNGSIWTDEDITQLAANATYYDIPASMVANWNGGIYIRYRVGSKSTYAPTVFSGYSANVRKLTSPMAPTALTVSPTTILTALRFGWTKGVDGVSNPITGHDLRYQTSSNGTTWSAETAVNLAASAIFYDVPSATISGWAPGTFVRFRVGSKSNLAAAVYSDYSATARKPTPPTPPTAPLQGPNAFETALRLSWTKGANGILNPITGQEVKYQTSDNGTDWSAETTVSVATAATYYDVPAATLATWSRGKYVRFRAGSVSAYASTVYSGYSSAIRKNRVPNAPTGTPTTNKTVYVPGEMIVVSFQPANPKDPDNGIAGDAVGYEVKMQNSDSEDYNNAQIMGINASPTAVSVNVSTTGWSPGYQWKFFVRAYDSYGVRGAWSAASALILVGVPMKVLVNGVLKTASEHYVLVGGVLKRVSEIKVLVNGALKNLTV